MRLDLLLPHARGPEAQLSPAPTQQAQSPQPQPQVTVTEVTGSDTVLTEPQGRDRAYGAAEGSHSSLDTEDRVSEVTPRVPSTGWSKS